MEATLHIIVRTLSLMNNFKNVKKPQFDFSINGYDIKIRRSYIDIIVKESFIDAMSIETFKKYIDDNIEYININIDNKEITPGTIITPGTKIKIITY